MGWPSVFTFFAALAVFARGSYQRDFSVKPDDYIVLLAADAKLLRGLKPEQRLDASPGQLGNRLRRDPNPS